MFVKIFKKIHKSKNKITWRRLYLLNQVFASSRRPKYKIILIIGNYLVNWLKATDIPLKEEPLWQIKIRVQEKMRLQKNKIWPFITHLNWNQWHHHNKLPSSITHHYLLRKITDLNPRWSQTNSIIWISLPK